VQICDFAHPYEKGTDLPFRFSPRLDMADDVRIIPNTTGLVKQENEKKPRTICTIKQVLLLKSYLDMMNFVVIKGGEYLALNSFSIDGNFLVAGRTDDADLIGGSAEYAFHGKSLPMRRDAGVDKKPFIGRTYAEHPLGTYSEKPG